MTPRNRLDWTVYTYSYWSIALKTSSLIQLAKRNQGVWTVEMAITLIWYSHFVSKRIHPFLSPFFLAWSRHPATLQRRLHNKVYFSPHRLSFSYKFLTVSERKDSVDVLGKKRELKVTTTSLDRVHLNGHHMVCTNITKFVSLKSNTSRAEGFQNHTWASVAKIQLMDVSLVSPQGEMCRRDFEKQNKLQFIWHWPLPLVSLACIDITVKSEATN